VTVAIAPPTFEVSGLHRWLVVITCLIETLAVALSATIINVAVPEIMGTFGVGGDQAQWMATSFFAAMTAGMLASDWIARSFGQRNAFIGGILLFLAASVIGGTAPNFGVIVLGRTIQGLAAGALLPLAMFAMFSVFPPSKRATVTGLFGISFVLGPGLGPWFGGLAIDAYDWRFTFYVAIAPAFLAMVGAAFVLPGRDPASPRTRFDWQGFILVAIFLAATLTGLSNGQLKGWSSDFVVFSLLLGLVALAAFVFWELVVVDPIFDVRLLASPRFAVANMLSFLFGVTLFGSIYLQPIFVQIVQSYTPTRAGEVLIPGGLILGLVLPLTGRLADRIAPQWPIMLGFAIFAVSHVWLGIVDANTSFWTFALLVVLGRVGGGMIFPPLTVAGFREVPPARLGAANGMLNFTRQLGGAFGINVLAIYLEQQTAFYSTMLAATQHEANATTQALLARVQDMLGAAGLPAATEVALSKLYLGRMIAAQANALAFRDTFIVLGLAAAVAAVLGLVVSRRRI
jgi:EmrB/QacA subfamily drug resistance transporter